jgi:hypothetical protein
MTQRRESRLEQLKEATEQNTKSKALDQAAEFYIRMAGDTVAIPTGAFTELMQKAESKGSLTPQEIATILNTDQLPVAAETIWTVGEK